MNDNKDYYKVLLVGNSGKGKTYSFRNMNPDTTGFINVENKPLPFKNAFKHHSRPTNYQQVLDTIKQYAENKDITAIVIDSFSAYMDLVLEEARRTKKGFDVWNLYAEFITKFNFYVKKCNKQVYITAHYELLGIEGNLEKRVKVKGKEFEGLVEKDYTMVLYADNKINDKGKFEYFYFLAAENTSAKCPPDIFGEDILKIQNDVKFIDDKINQFIN